MPNDFEAVGDLQSPINRTVSADKDRIKQVLISAVGKFMDIKFSKGKMVEGEFVEVTSDSRQVRDTVDDDDNPADAFWTDAVTGNQIWNKARASEVPMSNGQILQEYFRWLLEVQGV